MQFFYVYVGKRKGDQWYIGFSTDLRRRVQEHNQKYDFDLLYYEAYTSETKARERERKLKIMEVPGEDSKTELQNSFRGRGSSITNDIFSLHYMKFKIISN
jgi:predicted GIY-YIG superfamily endonuclease